MLLRRDLVGYLAALRNTEDDGNEGLWLTADEEVVCSIIENLERVAGMYYKFRPAQRPSEVYGLTGNILENPVSPDFDLPVVEES